MSTLYKDKKCREKRARRERAHQRLRQRVEGTPARPRLSVFKSSRHLYAQVINDLGGHTLAAASTLEAGIRESLGGAAACNLAAAKLIGELVAERALAKGITAVVFDRGGYRYHGRVKQLAEAARAKGLQF
ncbi:MAG: 50S ribosomal protein L18 [Acidobacteria bacterium]|jgi:large subunit ribosomal protein L18|nr:50S ribosomal protein L18 [Thermoanaerobaculia bacterium]MDI9631074.1 50S ribosomal protein L18 [Acidobacteriota bacterium]OQC41951.1 MAG: 50S ribosomal protein L18 [Acidobacteria bacterium ADurb.Bin051]MBP7812330.1 50S ribosomal protein L18 [Thermoanaerobaculia bacterium]NLN10904.1 50S ribosomal protein L18 [Acidobacteriota bacterium]